MEGTEQTNLIFYLSIINVAVEPLFWIPFKAKRERKRELN